MASDLDAAVARLEERCRHGELRRVGVVSADVRLLLADWERLREMTSPAAGLARLEQELGIMDKTIAERDAARAEVERLRAALTKIDAIRNSIVGTQSLNWSAHAYPLVAALEEAGFKGLGYEKARAEARTTLDELARLRERDARARAVLGEALGDGHNLKAFAGTMLRWREQPGVNFDDEARRIVAHAGKWDACLAEALALLAGES